MQFSYTTLLQNYRGLVKDNGFSLVVFAEKKKSEVVTLESGVKKIEIGVGVGNDLEKFNTEKFILKIREIVVLAKKHKIKKIALNITDLCSNQYLQIPIEKGIELIAINLVLANYEFRECKSEPPKEGFDDVEDVLILEQWECLKEVVEIFKRGVMIAEKKNEARTLCNMPPNILTPHSFFADVCRRFSLASTDKIRIIHWTAEELKRDKFGGIMAVGGGSQAKPLVENMPGRGSFKVEDIIKMYGGKTVRILNTDAEGRIILADAIAYAVKEFSPEVIIDVATLTGAAVVALGEIMSGVFTRDKELSRLLVDLGEENSEYMWPLPINDKFKKEMEDDFADIKNTGKARWGGASTAAAFLEHFVGDVPWAHIDIAPRMKSGEGENLAKGAVGEPVQTLLAYLRHLEDLDEKEAKTVKGPSTEII